MSCVQNFQYTHKYHKHYVQIPHTQHKHKNSLMPLSMLSMPSFHETHNNLINVCEHLLYQILSHLDTIAENTNFNQSLK
jgi:hypothetical protein